MKKLIGIIALSLCMFTAYPQQQREIEIFFDQGSYAIDSTYMGNGESLRLILNQFQGFAGNSAKTITKVIINGYSSPDGAVSINKNLSQNRANAIYKYIRPICSLHDTLIVINNNGIVWNTFREMVVESETPNKAEVIDLIDNVSVETWAKVNKGDRWKTLTNSLNKELMDLKIGVPYRYMAEHIFPKMRKSTITVISYQRETEPILAKEEVKYATPAKEIVEVVETEALEPTVESEPTVVVQDNREKKPLFALKTNLLYDLAIIPNIEIEVNIKEHWSIAAEWIFPWWVSNNNAYALQMLSAQVEGRYWFGNSINKPKLIGWFTGLYAGGGLYDLQWDSNGYQGEFFIASGLSGGYAHTINKSGSLRMEYSLGFGYLQTNYRYYEGMEDNAFLVWQRDGRYTWIGPTKAKASLVWMLGKRGGKR